MIWNFICLYQRTKVPRIWMMQGECVISLFGTVALLQMFQIGVGLAGARGVTIIAGTLGWFGGADVQEILEYSSLDRRQHFQNEGAWAEVVLKIWLLQQTSTASEPFRQTPTIQHFERRTTLGFRMLEIESSKLTCRVWVSFYRSSCGLKLGLRPLVVSSICCFTKAELKVFTDTWDGSWDIRISWYGQVGVDLEDPVALATFLVTANIKLIRAEWLGDAPDAISGETAAGQLFEKVDHFSNFGKAMSIWTFGGYRANQGHTSKQSSRIKHQAGVLYYHKGIMCVQPARPLQPWIAPHTLYWKFIRQFHKLERIHILLKAFWSSSHSRQRSSQIIQQGGCNCTLNLARNVKRCCRKFHIFGC